MKSVSWYVLLFLILSMGSGCSRDSSRVTDKPSVASAEEGSDSFELKTVASKNAPGGNYANDETVKEFYGILKVLSSGDRTTAVKQLESFIAKNRNQPLAVIYLADAKLADGNAEEARSLLKKASTLTPS